jgi:hypothetical protein
MKSNDGENGERLRFETRHLLIRVMRAMSGLSLFTVSVLAWTVRAAEGSSKFFDAAPFEIVIEEGRGVKWDDPRFFASGLRIAPDRVAASFAD